MDEINESINKKTSIMLSRNSPVALVVGAGSFLGSHLTDQLLTKGIQVIGVDDLEDGARRNLAKATENRNFHLVIESPEKIDLDLPRLDYIFILPAKKWDLRKVLELLKRAKCRCLLISSISLYEKDSEDEYRWLKQKEEEVAKFAEWNKLNARILRLGAVYGPRMDFRTKDPLVKLIQQSLTESLQKDVALEFSSRALYAADAVNLAIKTIFSGATSQKIFDGVLPTPVKIAEVKQVLLDPAWYEDRDFIPTELPPWPTPNLEKTIKVLNWHPKEKLVTGLKETLNYFKDNEITVPEIETHEEKKAEKRIDESWNSEKQRELELFKGRDGNSGSEKKKMPKGAGPPKLRLPLSKIYLFAVAALVVYALVWPVFVLGWGIFTFQSGFSEGIKNLRQGEFEKGLGNIDQANSGIMAVKSIFDSLEPIRKTGLLSQEFESGDNLIYLSLLSVSSTKSSILGIQALLQSLKAVTGESTESPASFFSTAQIELTSANEDLSKTNAMLKDNNFKNNLPGILSPAVVNLSDKLVIYGELINKAQVMSRLLPAMVALDGKKSYLVLLQNNMELRPGGGFIGSFANLTFEGGKLKKLDVNDIYAIDGQLGIHVEPPKEIKEDLGQKDWFLRDSNWEPDFPTAARQAEWFYTKETGNRVEGIVALDVSAIKDLLGSVGTLDLADYNEKVTSDNLFEKTITYAETGFFPGSQAKKSFITALTNQLFNKIFFLPQNNWPGIISSLGKSLDEKHISIYLNDSKLFAYLSAENWTHVLPRQSAENQNQDFLSLVEANLGANKVNYYLDRNYNLETTIGKDGEVAHTLRINYTNRSPSDVFPGGKYKNRMRVYLPFGTKLTKASWGEQDITKNVNSFVDYGRSGYSFLLELLPKEQKTLVLEYSVPIRVQFKDSKAGYRLNIVKQAGTAQDPLQWTISYPISYKVVSNQTKSIGPQEQKISTDLSKDRSFEVEFKK